LRQETTTIVPEFGPSFGKEGQRMQEVASETIALQQMARLIN